LILLTSLGRREVKAEATEFAALLTKPLKPSALFNALVAVFSGQPTRILARQTGAGSQFDAQMGQRHPLHILLAEDNATNQKLALRILARMGYQADVVSNGLEVLEALLRQPYDVVLMDVQMPELDGLETTRRLRTELAQTQQPQVIAMTANAMQGDRELCLAAGMNDYVSKPIRVEELVRALAASSPLAASPESNVKQPVAEAHGPGLGPPASLGVREPTPESAVLDPQALHRLLATVGGEFAYLAELIDSFLADAPQLLTELEQCAQAGDAAGVRRIAHSLKSNGADLGAIAFTEQCKELEGLAKTGALDDAAARVARLQAEYRSVEAALGTVLNAGIDN
jgi:CheY-like chemotaxis protein/HPt (histidine-containing phosphotransfer) domain-containing protein